MGYFTNLFKAVFNAKEVIKERIYFSSDEHDDNYMIPMNHFSGGNSIGFDLNSDDNESYNTSDNQPPKKRKVKPIDVVDEIKKPPTNFSLDALDHKIEILKDKKELTKQHYSKKDIELMIACLENRKKYHNKSKDGKTFSEFYGLLDTTDEEKIDALLEKNELVMKESDLFVPEFPDEAIKIMKLYSEKTVELCGKKPNFQVIAEDSKFKKAYEKRDPILLAQSPFGLFWYILGAWDEEMILLKDL